MIVDASVVLAAFLPDGTQAQAQAVMRDHVIGRLRLSAPDLLLYEVTNAVVQAVRRGRIDTEQAQAVLASLEGMGIELQAVAWPAMVSSAQQFDRPAYDAAYVVLADATGQAFITGDRRLYNAIREHLDRVLWLGNYQGSGGDCRGVRFERPTCQSISALPIPAACLLYTSPSPRD